jgi:prepilin-type processing-associated H-X9-DG protein
MQQIATPLVTLICPTRRTAIVYPEAGNQCYYAFGFAAPPALVGKTDYAANGGTSDDDAGTWGCFGWGPGSYAAGDAYTNAQWLGAAGSGVNHAVDTGVVFTHSAVTMADIADGASNTYLFGEKYMDSDNYTNGQDTADNQCWDIAMDWDILRYTGYSSAGPGTAGFAGWVPYFTPLQDTAGYSIGFQFGSAHASGFNMSFCDGSTRFMSYTIDPTIHWCLGNRADGQMIDMNKL